MTTLYRYAGDATFHPVNGGPPLILDATEAPDHLGTPNNRPTLTSPPDATNTGPRQPYTTTMTGPAALAAALAAPPEDDGRRYLRRARITTGITLDSTTHGNIVFEDCVITSTGSYVINAFYDGTPLTPDEWPEFRFCDISGGASATVIGCATRFLRCNIHHGEDIIKAREAGGEFYACFLHSTYHGPESHSDIVQIVSGATGLLLHWNNCQAFNSDDSPSAAGDVNNGVLQTGSATRAIGPTYWHDNWFDGGGYTIRTGDGDDLNGHARAYEFRRNKFGRNSRWGPVYGPTTTGVDFDDSNVWADTGLPVLD